MQQELATPLATFTTRYFGVDDVCQLFHDKVVVCWRRSSTSGESTIPLNVLLPDAIKTVFINPEWNKCCVCVVICAVAAVVGTLNLPTHLSDIAAVGGGVGSATFLVGTMLTPYRVTNWQFTNQHFQAILNVSARTRDVPRAEAFVAGVATQIRSIKSEMPAK